MGKDISAFYGIKNINGADIYMTNDVLNIYKLTPSLVLEINEELENTFYSAYIWSIKMMRCDYQIVVDTSKLRLDKAFDNLSKVEYKTENGKQKKYIYEYKNYLKSLSDNVEIYERSIYIVSKKLNGNEEKKFVEGLNNLNNVGIEVEKVTDREEILRILYSTINRSGE